MEALNLERTCMAVYQRKGDPVVSCPKRAEYGNDCSECPTYLNHLQRLGAGGKTLATAVAS